MSAEPLPLLRAYPHRWGPGKVHRLNSMLDRTLCGKTLTACPGERFQGSTEQITCKPCRGRGGRT